MPAAAAAPDRFGDAYTETFFDDFIYDLCGIETMTTVTERWSITTYADGSSVQHVVRTFVSEDPRLPVEKGAGKTVTAPDGSRTVIGMPLLLIGPGGGVRVIDAGKSVFNAAGDVVTTRGIKPDLSNLAQYYCP